MNYDRTNGWRAANTAGYREAVLELFAEDDAKEFRQRLRTPWQAFVAWLRCAP